MSTIVADEATLRRVVAEEIGRVLKPALAALGDLRGSQGASSGDALMTGEEVAGLLRIDRRSLRRMIREGEIPKPITIGDRCLRWRRSAIEEWLRVKESRS